MTSADERLASHLRRIAATAIDAVLVPLLTLLLVMLTDVVEDAEDYRDSLWVVHVVLLAVLSYLLLNGYLLWTRAQTVGKAVLKVRIADASSGAPAPFWKLVGVRALFFPLLFLAFAPPLTAVPVIDLAFIFGKRRRCLHDFAAGTIVVDA